MERVAAFVDRSGGPDACWPWTGSRLRGGYGRVNSGRRTLLAHKLVLENKLGRALAEGEVSRHRCHNPPCCNPDHLIPGTNQDNSDDMVRAGRALTGEAGTGAKLTALQVADILARAKAGPLNYEAVGRELGVTGRTVSYIVKGQRWSSEGAS